MGHQTELDFAAFLASNELVLCIKLQMSPFSCILPRNC